MPENDEEVKIGISNFPKSEPLRAIKEKMLETKTVARRLMEGTSVDFANSEDVDEMLCLWEEGFDEHYFGEKFLKDLEPEKITLVYRKAGMVVAMLHMIPCELYVGLENYDTYEDYMNRYGVGEPAIGFYLYALATKKEYRGQGIMGEMIEKTTEIAAAIGMQYLFLLPANEKLSSYYEKYGFEKKGNSNKRNDILRRITLMFERKIREYVEEELRFDEEFQIDVNTEDIINTIEHQQAIITTEDMLRKFLEKNEEKCLFYLIAKEKMEKAGGILHPWGYIPY